MSPSVRSGRSNGSSPQFCRSWNDCEGSSRSRLSRACGQAQVGHQPPNVQQPVSAMARRGVAQPEVPSESHRRWGSAYEVVRAVGRARRVTPRVPTVWEYGARRGTRRRHAAELNHLPGHSTIPHSSCFSLLPIRRPVRGCASGNGCDWSIGCTFHEMLVARPRLRRRSGWAVNAEARSGVRAENQATTYTRPHGQTENAARSY